MSAIPEDIRAKAWTAAKRITSATPIQGWAQVIADELMAERERCAKMLQPWKRRAHLSLHCGEVTAQEFRTVVAVLNSCQGAIRSPDTPTPQGET